MAAQAQRQEQQQEDRYLFDRDEAYRLRGRIREMARKLGYELRLLNNDEHWEFKQEGALVDWWPNTGRYRVNKMGHRADKATWLNELRQVLLLAVFK